MLFSISDEKLIQKALGGSQRSWLTLVQRHEKMIYNFCLRMTRNPSDAMDLMQEVFLLVYRHLPSYQGDGRFRAWMMRIATNKTIDFIRQRSRSPSIVDDEYAEAQFLAHEAPAPNNPEWVCAHDSDNRHIQLALQTLSPDQRVVVELKFFQQFTFEDISQQTGVPINTVKSRFYMALDKMKSSLLPLEKTHVM
jgi:RNA polymerase sigma-70 factor, ECF subfamily